MMDCYTLPRSLEVGGKEYEIRTDYRVIIDILTAMNDDSIFEPGMTEEEKQQERVFTMLQILYVDFDSIPPSGWKEAAEKACEFIDCGMVDDGKKKPRIMDWTQDAPIIIPAINKNTHEDVRSAKYMHWWTFFGLYTEVGESTFATVVSIRNKLSKGKKLEKWEKEFYHNNRKLIDLRKKHVERSEEEKDEIRALLGLKPANK